MSDICGRCGKVMRDIGLHPFECPAVRKGCVEGEPILCRTATHYYVGRLAEITDIGFLLDNAGELSSKDYGRPPGLVDFMPLGTICLYRAGIVYSRLWRGRLFKDGAERPLQYDIDRGNAEDQSEADIAVFGTGREPKP